MNKCLFCNKDCKNKFCSLEHYRQSVSDGKYPGSMSGKKHTIENIEKFRETNAGENNGNYGKKHPNMHSTEFKVKQSANLKTNRKNHKSQKGISKPFSESHLNSVRIHIQKLNEEGFENKGGKCKFYNVDGVNIQGRYELYFYLFNDRKPIKITKPIKTPYGWYTPDFQYNDDYIEIKSTYTLSTSVDTGQLKKIAWISKNIQKVRIILLQENVVHNFLSTINLAEFVM